MIKPKKISKFLVRQSGLSDCGVACLASVINFYGGDADLEELRIQSGTSKLGISMFALLKTAQKEGLKAKGFKVIDLEELKKLTKPAIIHVLLNKSLQHYLVYFGYDNRSEKFTFGDPGKGTVFYSEEELLDIWQSKTLLTLEPNEGFVNKKTDKSNKIKWIREMLRADFSIIKIAILLGIFIAVFGMTLAIFSQRLIDDIIPNKKYDELLLGLIVISIILSGNLLLNFLRSFFLVKQSQSFNIRIISYFSSYLLRLPKSFFDSRKMGELITRMNDTRRIQNMISSIISNILIELLIFIVSLTLILIYSWMVGLIIIAIASLYAIVFAAFNQKIINIQRSVLQYRAFNENNYIDVISGIDEIKIANKEDSYAKKIRSVYEKYQEKIFDLGFLSAKYNLFSDLIGVLIFVGVLGLCTLLIFQNQLKVGQMVAIFSVSNNLVPSLKKIILFNVQIQEANVAYNRMRQFTKLQLEDKDNEHTDTSLGEVNSISINQLYFAFPNSKNIFEGLSLELQKNKIVAILGENGSGKSTLIQVLQKFQSPNKNSIFINESIPFEQVSSKEWRSKIAVVPQKIKLFDDTLIYNIVLSEEKEEQEKGIVFCQKLGFHHFFKVFPFAYHTILGSGGINISGGQRQLVAFARALYKKPQVLLLDEPITAVDLNVKLFMFETLAKIKSHLSILIVTHHLDLASKADKVYVLDKKLIKDFGTPKELLESDNLFSQLYNQAKI